MNKIEKEVMKMYLANKTIAYISIELDLEPSKIEEIISNDEYAKLAHEESIKNHKEKSNAY